MADKLFVIIGIPTAGMVPAGFAYSLAAMVAKFGAHGCPTVPECEVKLSILVLESSNWITNREKLARMACDDGATHLMFLDDDMVFEPQVLEILLGRRQDIVLTNYLIKTLPPKDFVAVDLKEQRLATKDSSVGIVPVTYSGFGVSLIRTEVFRKTPQPWFLPVFNAEKSEYTTEDNPFFQRARDAGFTVFLDQDASKLVAHVGRKTWQWNEVNHG